MFHLSLFIKEYKVVEPIYNTFVWPTLSKASRSNVSCVCGCRLFIFRFSDWLFVHPIVCRGSFICHMHLSLPTAKMRHTHKVAKLLLRFELTEKYTNLVNGLNDCCYFFSLSCFCSGELSAEGSNRVEF